MITNTYTTALTLEINSSNESILIYETYNYDFAYEFVNSDSTHKRRPNIPYVIYFLYENGMITRCTFFSTFIQPFLSSIFNDEVIHIH